MDPRHISVPNYSTKYESVLFCFVPKCWPSLENTLTLQWSKTTMHWGSLLTGEDEVSTSGATITGSCWSQKSYLQNTKWDRCCGNPVAWSILTWKKRKAVYNLESSKKHSESQTQAPVLTLPLTASLHWPNPIQSRDVFLHLWNVLFRERLTYGINDLDYIQEDILQHLQADEEHLKF